MVPGPVSLNPAPGLDDWLTDWPPGWLPPSSPFSQKDNNKPKKKNNKSSSIICRRVPQTSPGCRSPRLLRVHSFTSHLCASFATQRLRVIPVWLCFVFVLLCRICWDRGTLYVNVKHPRTGVITATSACFFFLSFFLLSVQTPDATMKDCFLPLSHTRT